MTRLPDCAWCGRPDPTGGYVCPDCYAPVDEALRQMIRFAAEPEVNIARQARYGPSDGPRSAEPPIPVDLDASAAAWAAAHVVVTWMDHIARTRGVPLPTRPPRPVGPLCPGAGWSALPRRCDHPACDAIRDQQPEHPVAAAAAFVRDHLDWLRHTPDADAAGEELLGASAAVVRLIENPADRWYAGVCAMPLADDPGQHCTAELYAWPGVTWVRCPGCRTVHQTGPRIRWLLDEAKDVLGTATQLATAATRLGRTCTPGQLRALAQRGRLTAVDRDAWNRPRYRFGDVLDRLDQIAEQKRVDAEDRARRAEERARRAAAKACDASIDQPLDQGVRSGASGTSVPASAIGPDLTG